MNQHIFTVSEVMTKKPKPSNDQLQFGRYFTDHMFMMEYHHQKGWYDGKIIPYQSITLDPASMIFHYGQTVFEGLKAYATENGEIQLFRPEENIARLNRSNERKIGRASCRERVKIEERARGTIKRRAGCDEHISMNGECLREA